MAQTLFVVSAPSGAGKTSLVRAVVKRLHSLTVSISHTTRPQRTGETDGVDYHFIDMPTFEKMVADDLFLESAKVFDHSYGTSRRWVEQQLRAGDDVMLEIDWQGAQRVRAQLGATVGIFIFPPSINDLRVRLEKRAREDSDVITRRMEEAMNEMRHYREYDYLVVNDDFERAVDDITATITAIRRGEEPARRPPPTSLLRLL